MLGCGFCYREGSALPPVVLPAKQSRFFTAIAQPRLRAPSIDATSPSKGFPTRKLRIHNLRKAANPGFQTHLGPSAGITLWRYPGAFVSLLNRPGFSGELRVESGRHGQLTRGLNSDGCAALTTAHGALSATTALAPCFNSRFSRSSSLSRSRSVLVTPARRPWSRSACRTHLRSVSAVQPTFAAIEPIAAHCESYSASCGETRQRRAARQPRGQRPCPIHTWARARARCAPAVRAVNRPAPARPVNGRSLGPAHALPTAAVSDQIATATHQQHRISKSRNGLGVRTDCFSP